MKKTFDVKIYNIHKDEEFKGEIAPHMIFEAVTAEVFDEAELAEFAAKIRKNHTATLTVEY